MRVFLKAALAILVLLAVSSAIPKIMLVEREVIFFGSYGFSNPLLIAFGATQLIGGALLIFEKTRIVGALLVALTFLVSGVTLIMAKNIPFTVMTAIALSLLALVVKQSLKNKQAPPF